MAIDAHWWWLLLALALGLAEIALPGFSLMWLGAAALLTGFATLGFGLALGAQFALFALASIAAVYLARRWFLGHPIESADPHLNDRTARLIGSVVTVVEPIVDGFGRVGVGDGAWPACGEDAGVGARVRVVGASGTVLDVEPLDALPTPDGAA